MARVNLTDRLEQEYVRLYETCEIRQERFGEVDAVAVAVLRDRARYEQVGDPLGIPWYLVAAIHNLESSRRFDRHLHNGDRLTARTTHWPPGRPAGGEPPFTWEESATDALKLRRLHQVDAWPLARVLYEAEGYNGFGYRLHHPEVLSPYLWGFSKHYDRGKYVADGTWSATARSRQCGAGSLIRRLEERGDIPALSGRMPRKALLVYSPRRKRERADDLQRFLNTFPGIVLRVDGVAGPKSSDAVREVFGFYLEGDPRAEE